MSYICNDCKEVFLEPEVERGGFHHAFGFHREELPICPFCGSDDIEPAVTCPKCNGDMAETDTLCRGCQDDLETKARAFFSSLTEAEVDQLDLWLDGIYIKDSKFRRPAT